MQHDPYAHDEIQPGNLEPTDARGKNHHISIEPGVFDIIAKGNETGGDAALSGLSGRQIGNYRLLRMLGQGGFACVFLGEHLYLKRLAAIKVLRMALNNQDKERFLSEARLLATLTHPHIVHVLDFGVAQRVETIGNEQFVEYIPYLVMDFASDNNLRVSHPAGSCLSIKTVVDYVKQIADALQYAHNKGIIHCDVKPENLLLDEQQTVMLSDFGLALFAPRPELLSTREMHGTLPYAAPEQLRGKPCFASDQYSLGVIAYEWLCGRRPFVGDDVTVILQHISSAPPSLRSQNPGISSAVEEVVLKALAKDPGQRHASVQAFARALEFASDWNASSYSHVAITLKDASSYQPPTRNIIQPPVGVTQIDQHEIERPASTQTEIAFPQFEGPQLSEEREPEAFFPAPKQRARKNVRVIAILVLALLISVIGTSFIGVRFLNGLQPSKPASSATIPANEVDFSVGPPRVRNMTLVRNDSTLVNGFSILGQGGQVIVNYTLPQNVSLTGRSQPNLSIVIRALVSRAGDQVGYAPMSLRWNNQFIVQDFTIPGGGFNANTSSFQIPSGFLTQGSNQITLAISPQSQTYFWIYDLKIMQGLL